MNAEHGLIYLAQHLASAVYLDPEVRQSRVFQVGTNIRRKPLAEDLQDALKPHVALLGPKVRPREASGKLGEPIIKIVKMAHWIPHQKPELRVLEPNLKARMGL